MKRRFDSESKLTPFSKLYFKLRNMKYVFCLLSFSFGVKFLNCLLLLLRKINRLKKIIYSGYIYISRIYYFFYLFIFLNNNNKQFKNLANENGGRVSRAKQHFLYINKSFFQCIFDVLTIFSVLFIAEDLKPVLNFGEKNICIVFLIK